MLSPGLRAVLFAPRSSAASVAAGATGLWWIDQYNSTTKTVPNAAATATVSGNLLRGSRRMFNNTDYWVVSSSTISADGSTSFTPDGTSDASVSTGSAGWSIRPQYVDASALPAGTYTASIWARVTSGTKNFAFTTDNTSTRLGLGSDGVKVGGVTGDAVATTTWQRFTLPYTKGSPSNTGLIAICDRDGSTAATLQICDFELFPGDVSATLSATTPTVYGGHLTLGQHAYDTTTNGKYVSGELDMTTANAQGLVQFASNVAYSTFTAQVLSKKTAAGSSYQAFLSKVTAYNQFSAYLEQGTQARFPNLQTDDSSPGITRDLLSEASGTGLWPRLSAGYHVITHRYDGSKYSLFYDDILVAEMVTSNTIATGLLDLFFCNVNTGGLTTGDKFAGGMTLYSSSLTNAQVRSNVAILQARARTNGLTATSVARVITFDGDSRTGGAATRFPYVFGPNSSSSFVGANKGISASTLANLTTRISNMTEAIPPASARAGRKFIAVVGPLGTNDSLGVGITAATYSVSMAAYTDALYAAGFTHVVLCTEMPDTIAAHNTARASLNTIYRSSWPGSNPIYLADLDTLPWIAYNGGDNTVANPTKWDDGRHQSVAGDVDIETVIRTVINAL